MQFCKNHTCSMQCHPEVSTKMVVHLKNCFTQVLSEYYVMKVPEAGLLYPHHTVRYKQNSFSRIESDST